MYNLQPEKKSGGCTKILAIIGGLALVVVAFFAVAIFSVSNSVVSSSRNDEQRVVYRVTTSRDWGGCYGFDATYEMPSGTAQKGVSICNGDTFTQVDQRTGRRGDFVYLSVQNDEQLARIGCEIHINGTLVYQTHSEGQYVIASCSGSIP